MRGCERDKRDTQKKKILIKKEDLRVMEIVKTVIKAFLILIVVILFFDFIESKVRNLSCNCLYKNYSNEESSPHYCPIGTSSRSTLDSNWFEYCQFEGKNKSCEIRAVVLLPKNDR